MTQTPDTGAGLAAVIDALRQHQDRPDLAPQDSATLADLGLDSLDVIELEVMIEESHGIVITDAMAVDTDITIAEFAAKVNTLLVARTAVPEGEPQ